MKPSRLVRRAIERLTGVHLLRYLPHGLDVFRDIRTSLPGHRMHTFLDVGANNGQSALLYAETHPKAEIHSFEPVAATFDLLVRNTRAEERIHCHRYALGSSTGQARMSSMGTDRMNRILGAEAAAEQVEVMPMITLDDFLAQRRIERVSYLKIDTEGHDLEVLEGASGALRDQRIDLVELEAGMNPHNTFHVPFHELAVRMAQDGYALFGIYHQTHEWKTRSPQMRRCDPVFLSKRMMKQYEGTMAPI
ncbi:MAG TPA: FkbM family methyltransferase [Flavobacteriales bacterium]